MKLALCFHVAVISLQVCLGAALATGGQEASEGSQIEVQVTEAMAQAALDFYRGKGSSQGPMEGSG